MDEISSLIESKIKNIIPLFRDISINSLKIIDMDLFPIGTRLFFDYLYDDKIYKDEELLNILIKDMKVSGIYTPLELIANPINMTTNVEKKTRQGNSAVSRFEEKNLLGMLLKTQIQIDEIKMEGKENNKLYMEAPSKIKSILAQMDVNKEATRTITEFISALIMEVRSYKLDHSNVFVRLDEIKKENRSLTREERQRLGLDEILAKQNEIRANTDKLLKSLNSVIKSTKEKQSFKENFDQLNYILKNSIEILPTIDYENIKAHEKLKKSEKTFTDEREQQLRKQIGAEATAFKNSFKYLINLIYSELLWDKTNKKIRIESEDFVRDFNSRLLKKIFKEKLKATDPAFYSIAVDAVRPSCKIILFQNAGRSYFDDNHDIIVIHNYLIPESASDEKIKEIAETFAQAVLKLNTNIFNEFLNHHNSKVKKENSAKEMKKLFIDQYTSCFMERFSYFDLETWVSFCEDNPYLEFLTKKYFSSKRR